MATTTARGIHQMLKYSTKSREAGVQCCSPKLYGTAACYLDAGEHGEFPLIPHEVAARLAAGPPARYFVQLSDTQLAVAEVVDGNGMRCDECTSVTCDECAVRPRHCELPAPAVRRRGRRMRLLDGGGEAVLGDLTARPGRTHDYEPLTHTAICVSYAKIRSSELTEYT
uniref:Uncharacterized protein n=1 Tax=Oryza punctata TaxID=4537 RepID=A0A0E0JVE4_ORYPU